MPVTRIFHPDRLKYLTYDASHEIQTRLVLTGVRTGSDAASIEVSAGLELGIDWRSFTRLPLLPQSTPVFSAETSQA